MGEIKVGSVVRLKADCYNSVRRFFTVSRMEDDKVYAVGFNSITNEFITIKTSIACFILEKE